MVEAETFLALRGLEVISIEHHVVAGAETDQRKEMIQVGLFQSSVRIRERLHL